MEVGTARNFYTDFSYYVSSASSEVSAVSSVKSDAVPGYMAKGFDPAFVPPEQLIRARKTTPVSVVRSSIRSVKNTFWGLIRQFKMLIIVANVCRQGFSIESIQQAAAKSEGGLLVKVIQFVCSSPEILNSFFGNEAQQFLDALSHVSNSNKPMSRKELIRCLKEAGVPYDPERLRESVHLGTGSVGDVKEIILLNGERQVVKMISPASEVRVFSDLKVLRFLLGLIRFFKPGLIGQGTRQAINAFFDSVRDELNLVNEAQRTQKQGFAFRALAGGNHYRITDQEMPDCAIHIPDPVMGINIPNVSGQNIHIPVNFKVPEVSPEYLTSKAMCMQKVEGATLASSDSEKLRGVVGQLFNVDPRTVTDDTMAVFRQHLKKLAYSQWMHCYAQTGFFNGDMHDGNVMVAVENGQLSIYFIDLGNGQQVSRDVVKATFTVLGAMNRLRSTDDEQLREAYADMVIDNLKSMGEYDPNEADWDRLKASIKDLMAYGTPGEIAMKVLDVFDLAYPCNVTIPKEIVALFRAKILIDSQQQQQISGDVLLRAIPDLLRLVQHNPRQPLELPAPVNGEGVSGVIPDLSGGTQQRPGRPLAPSALADGERMSEAVQRLSKVAQQQLGQPFDSAAPVNVECLLGAIPDLLGVVQQHLGQPFDPAALPINGERLLEAIPDMLVVAQQHLGQPFGPAAPVSAEHLLGAIPDLLRVAQQQLGQPFDPAAPVNVECLLEAIPELLGVVQQHLGQPFDPSVPVNAEHLLGAIPDLLRVAQQHLRQPVEPSASLSSAASF